MNYKNYFRIVIFVYMLLSSSSILIAQEENENGNGIDNSSEYVYKEDSISINNTHTIEDNPLAFSMPIKKFIRINSNFGRRSRRRWHYGIDLKTNLRDTIFNVWNGVVEKAENQRRGYGNFVEVKHFNGLTTVYAHLDSIMVNVGDTIKYHIPVGLAGRTGRATGVHLHFEIRYNNHPFNPVKLIDFAHKKVKDAFLASLEKKKPQNYLKIIKIRTYYVRKGDTIAKIAHRYDVKISTLYKLNGFLAKKRAVRPGQVIRIQ